MSHARRVVVTVAPGATGAGGQPIRFVATSRRFAVAVPGDRFSGGRVISPLGEPVPTSVTMSEADWDATVERDDELRDHLAAGRLTVRYG